MPHHDSLILMLVAGFVLAFAFGILANRFKLSPLVGYLLALPVSWPTRTWRCNWPRSASSC